MMVACADAGKTDPVPDPEPVRPDPSFTQLSPGVVEGRSYLLGREDAVWIDFQSGTVYRTQQLSSPDVPEKVDAGITVGEGGRVKLVSASKTYKTRMCVMTPKVMTPARFDAIRMQNDILGCQPSDIASAPFSTDELEDGTYVYFKTYSKEEGNRYGVIQVLQASSGQLWFNYKSEIGVTGPQYSGARHVTIADGTFLVDGKPYYVNGSAATMHHVMMAEYGANTCRVYTTNVGSYQLLDALYEAGLMLYAGLPCTPYASLSPATPNYDAPQFRKEKISSVLKIVEALKDHPAVLCWCLGNEVEGGGHQTDFGIYAYYGELAREIRKIDPHHPITAAFTETPTAAKVGLITTYCPDLDFVSFNSYYNFLYDHRAAVADNYTAMLERFGWTKPYMITEYGPTGTWQRKALLAQGRINDWGALIQLSSDEAAQRYIDCYKLIKDYRNCLGAFSFWWGYQTHGQVLGWYPVFTKDHYVLTAAEAMESCWRGTSYAPKSPKIQSWKSSIELNGCNVDGAQWSSSGKAQKNPVVTPGQECAARVYASCRSGHAASTLVYKWFIYRDCTYYHRGSDTDWTSVTYDDGEYIYDPSGQHMAMDEDARAKLFEDRTLSSVRFTAPTYPGNYRLYVIVTDPSNNTAASACLNFRVAE